MSLGSKLLWGSGRVETPCVSGKEGQTIPLQPGPGQNLLRTVSFLHLTL